MKNKKGLKRGLKEAKDLPKVQQEIFDMIVNQNLTPKQIAKRRKTTLTAVYKIIDKLRIKGRLKKGGLKIEGNYSTPSTGSIRCHAQRFKIFMDDSREYRKAREKTTRLKFKGCIVNLHARSIEIIAGDRVFFFGETSAEARENSWKFWDEFFFRLEYDLNIIIFKDRKQNIKETFSHYAVEGALEAEYMINEKDVYRLKASDDNRVFLQWDKSKGAEREYPRPGKALDDSEIFEPFFDDILQDSYATGEVLKMSELKQMMFILIRENRETASGLSTLVKFVEAQIPKCDFGKEERRGLKPDYVG